MSLQLMSQLLRIIKLIVTQLCNQAIKRNWHKVDVARGIKAFVDAVMAEQHAVMVP
jgi:hypothetical protein